MSELDELWGTLRYIEDRWRSADRRTLRVAFAELANGRPVSPSRLAELAGTTAEQARHALKSGPVGLDEDGNLNELFGVMLDATLHRVEVGGRVIYACCALVAHCVPVIVNETVRLESTDPVRRRLVTLELDANGVRRGSETVRACFPTPPAGPDMDSVRQAFCSHIQYFADARAAAAFASQDERRRIVEPGDLHELALATVSRIWS
ncbi:MAG: hypothetical protein GKS06_13615 [Acidobacteria bacterium]|nr:hypothetical protein [Acidobacteriota bacterium]